MSRTAVAAPTLRLYIWEGNGISSAYHDDGTLVVLAESPEQARSLIKRTRSKYETDVEVARTDPASIAAYNAYLDYMKRTPGGAERWQTPEGKAVIAERDRFIVPQPILPDGSDSALEREPDRVVEIDRAVIVAFNGGGYD